MRTLPRLAVAGLISLLVCPPLLAQQPLPCSETPLAVNLSGFRISCSKSNISKADYEKALASATEGQDWALDMFHALRPLDAETYSVIFSIAEKEVGELYYQIATQGHNLDAVDLNKATESMARLADAMFGGATKIVWLPTGTLADYNVQRYIMSFEGRSPPLPSDPRSCFAFVRYPEPSADQKYSNRLWGYYCRSGSGRLDDATMKRVLAAISVR